MGYQVKIGRELTKNLMSLVLEAAPKRCFYKMVFSKYAAYLQESTHAEVWFQ